MGKEQKRKKGNWGAAVALLMMGVIGAICGGMISASFGETLEQKQWGETLFLFAGALVGLYVAMYLQIAIHEAGHLVAGLLTGYGFSSFRLGSWMWVKQERGGLKLRRMSIAGTGGQCLMTPPELVDGKMPFLLYNLGGSLMNLLTAALCLGAGLLCRGVPWLSLFLQMMAVAGVGFALVNGIPFRLGTVNNDGSNALEMGRSPEALRAFWVQMKVAEQTAKGLRLKDMPAQWFSFPDEKARENSLVAALGVFYANRKLDEMDFAEARAAIDALLAQPAGIVGLHQNLLTCDRLYLALVDGEGEEVAKGLRTRELQKFMKQMGKFPSVIRTEYACALLLEGDAQAAEKARERFDRCAARHPYPSDIQSERELMACALARAGDESGYR